MSVIVQCNECGADCLRGQTHLEHNMGWRKKVLTSHWQRHVLAGCPGWDNAFVLLTIEAGTDRSSIDIAGDWDVMCEGQFYYRDYTDSGVQLIRHGDVHRSGFWFQKSADVGAFVTRYGGERMERAP